MYCVVTLVSVGNEIDVFSEVGVVNVVNVVSVVGVVSFFSFFTVVECSQ